MKTKISDKWVATSKLLDLWDTVSQPEDLKRDKTLFGDRLCGKCVYIIAGTKILDRNCHNVLAH